VGETPVFRSRAPAASGPAMNWSSDAGRRFCDHL